jgi:predicted metalloprotease with PDZ domain
VITVEPYTYQDLIDALNHTVPNDWNSLLQGDLLATRPTAVSPGLEAAGWTVSYSDEPNQAAVDAEMVSQQADLSASIGMIVDQDGTIVDVASDSAAGRAGLAPGSKLMGVNHRVYSADLLRQSIVGAETASPPIELLTLTDGYYTNVSVDYHQGLRSPHLVRISGKPDLLTAILRSRRTD